VDGGGNRRLVRRNQTGLAVPPTIENPVISPDASKVYVTLNCDGLYAGVSDNQLAVYDLSSGTLQIIADANWWALSPDGLKLVWNIGDALVAYDVISGIKTEVAKGREPFFSPDGDRIVYLHRRTMCEENDVWIMHMPQ
jgi:Tol biopolymer transport system component